MLFSGYIVGYLFLAGAGSGTFLIAACCCMADAWRATEGSERVARAVQPGFYAAPCLMALAGVLLLLDLGNAERVWRVAVMPFQSIMSVGAWLVVLLTALSGALAVAGLVWRAVPRPLLWGGCAVGAVLSVGVMGYTGLLLSDMVSIDFWRTPWLVALFVASSLSCGLAVLMALDALLARPVAARPLAGARTLWHLAAALTLAEACVLAVFVLAQYNFTDASRTSCDLLLSGSLAPAFWGGVCAGGLVLPFAVHLAAPLMARPAALLVSSAGVLAGGLMLRYCVVAAALFTPLALGAV